MEKEKRPAAKTRAQPADDKKDPKDSKRGFKKSRPRLDPGWIVVNRDLKDDPEIWNYSNRLKVWLWCKMKGAHEPHDITIAGREIHLKRGQFVMGRGQAARELNMPPSTVRNVINFLSCTGPYKYRSPQNPYRIVDNHAHKLFSIITVISYDKLQRRGQPKGQAEDTKNNYNK